MFDDLELQQVKDIADEARRGAVHDIQVIIENTVSKQLELLAEGQRTIIETLTPKSETEELKEEVNFLKSVIRMHAKQLAEQQQEIEQLKKAQ